MADTVSPLGLRVRPDGQVEGAAVPPGVVFYTAGDTPPAGYLEANGQAVSRATYADLFAAIGTLYGAGDGVNTFNVPNAEEKFIVGDDTAQRGNTGGDIAHIHGVSGTTDGKPPAEPIQLAATGVDFGTRLFNHTHTFSTNTDAAGNLPPYISLLPIIKT